MSDFMDYYKKEEERRSMTEEQRLELHKKQKALMAERFQNEDDDFYNETLPPEEDFEADEFEDTQLTEGARVPYRPNTSRPITRPIPQPPKPAAPAPAPRPQRVKPYQPPQEPDDDLFDDEPAVPQRKRHIKESVDTNPALSRAYTMMDEMQQKIENAFYRYGMSGLEKINKHLERIFEAIINPKPKEVVKYIEKPVIREKPVYRPQPVPAPVKENTAVETPEIVEPENNAELDENEMLNSAFIKMNESANSDILSAALIQQDEEQSKKQNDTLSRVKANAMLMQEAIDKKQNVNKPVVEESEPDVPQEEFEVVEDPVIEPPVEIVKEAAKPVKKPVKKKPVKKK